MSFSKLNFFFGEIMTKREQAMQNFKNGYNCAQAVLLAFSARLATDEKTLALISSSFGGGMGRMREVCGAVSGMFMVAGLKYGYSDPSAKQEKAELYALVQNLAPRPNRAPPLIIKSALVSNLSATRRNFLKICPENK